VPDAGRVVVEGEDTTDKRVQERSVGFVFQHYALFRHMTIFENLRAARGRERQLLERNHGKVHSLLKLRNSTGCRSLSAPALGASAKHRARQALAIEPSLFRTNLRRARCQCAADFAAAAPPARRDRVDQRLRDPRPGGGARSGRPRGGGEQGTDRQVGEPGVVCDNPATPFVYGSSSNVNVLDGA
jgi:sulfate transport system ATP-binding protein